MEHSKKFNIVKSYYEMYLQSGGTRGWSKHMVHNAVIKDWIRADEYEEITGEPYVE